MLSKLTTNLFPGNWSLLSIMTTVGPEVKPSQLQLACLCSSQK